MFRSARIKLTAWYLLIITIICLLFTVIIYSGINNELQQMKHVQKTRIVYKKAGLRLPKTLNRVPQVDPDAITALQTRLKVILFVINGILVGISGVAAYFLAGRTLNPIQAMVEKQDRFITDASHELRTPLTALKTSIEVNLRDKNLTLKEAKDLLADNLNDVNTLKNLSDNLLTLSSIHQTRNQIQEVSLSPIIESALQRITPTAKQKHISIVPNLEDLSVIGDKERLQELFIIFLDNAVKYSHEKSSVNISAKKVTTQAEIRIQDAGVGIHEKDIPHIFERFYRADASRTHSNKEGYGLGLSIAKEIIKSHKGSVRVKSILGKGTIFIISLPAKN